MTTRGHSFAVAAARGSWRPWLSALMACLCLPGTSHVYAANVTRLNVEAHLSNDGRLQVIETHQMQLNKGSESDFRVFGLSVDQAIVLKGITRIHADGTEHRLVDRVNQEVEGPDQFRYYPRGHVYFRYPAIAEEIAIVYRFEYELVHAVSPAWGLGAGAEPLSPEFGYGSPRRRLQEIIADIQEAWPAPTRRYRLDHDVLFPDRELRKDDALAIQYRLVFDEAWREVNPQAASDRRRPSSDYRVRRLLEYLPPARVGSARGPGNARDRRRGRQVLARLQQVVPRPVEDRRRPGCLP
jgi:hypothetical protein